MNPLTKTLLIVALEIVVTVSVCSRPAPATTSSPATSSAIEDSPR